MECVDTECWFFLGALVFVFLWLLSVCRPLFFSKSQRDPISTLGNTMVIRSTFMLFPLSNQTTTISCTSGNKRKMGYTYLILSLCYQYVRLRCKNPTYMCRSLLHTKLHGALTLVAGPIWLASHYNLLFAGIINSCFSNIRWWCHCHCLWTAQRCVIHQIVTQIKHKVVWPHILCLQFDSKSSPPTLFMLSLQVPIIHDRGSFLRAFGHFVNLRVYINFAVCLEFATFLRSSEQ